LKSAIKALENKLRNIRRDIGIEISRDELNSLGEKAIEVQDKITKAEQVLKSIEAEPSSFIIFPDSEISDMSDAFVQNGELRKECDRCKRNLAHTDYLRPDNSRCYTCAI
jgi:hypothetical protein